MATSFALTVSAYFSLRAARVPQDYRNAIPHLTLFALVAVLICWFNAALRSAQKRLRYSESNFRSLVTHAPYGICRCDSAGILLEANPALVKILGYASGSELVGGTVLLAYDFSGITSLADVGGGEGELLIRILELYPEMTGVVFDVANGLGSPRRAMGNGERCSFVAGNFFDSVPEGAEAYVLCGVVHDWSDDLAVAILRNCRKAMAMHGRALIVEMIVPKTNSASFSKLLDLNMMVMTAGRERTKYEFPALLDAADLRVTRIIPTMAPQSIIEAVPK